MQQIQIALASAKPWERKIAHISSTFTEAENVPPTLLDKQKRGWVLMCAQRPIMGDELAHGESVHGRLWAALDPHGDMFESFLKENERMDARIVLVLSREEIMHMSLVDNRYRDKYLEMGESERWKALQGKIDKLRGKPYSELKSLFTARL